MGYGSLMELRSGKPPMLGSLSRFLIEHEPHGAGFDVAHPAGAGGGRVAIACRGCGATHEYLNATVGFEHDDPYASRRSDVPPQIEKAPEPQPSAASPEAKPKRRQPPTGGTTAPLSAASPSERKGDSPASVRNVQRRTPRVTPATHG